MLLVIPFEMLFLYGNKPMLFDTKAIAMKAKTNSLLRAARHSIGAVVCAGAALLISTSSQAQNLFVSDNVTGDIYEFTPGGAQSTFATGLNVPVGLAFDSAGDLFAANGNSICEFTPGGVQSTFASGLNYPYGLAFNSAGDPFEVDQDSGNIYEFTPSGAKSTFASGLNDPDALAFNSAGNLFVATYPLSGGSSTIYEFTPSGAKSTFASGLDFPNAMAFNSSGERLCEKSVMN